MTVAVAMTAKTVKDVIVVAASAFFRREEAGDYVMLAGSDNKAHQKKVQIGIRNKESAQIIGGISAGDPVITSGGYALPDGTQIKIEAPEKEESPSSADEGQHNKNPPDEKEPKDEKGGTKDGTPE